MKLKFLINLKLVLLIFGSLKAQGDILPGLYKTTCARGTVKEQAYQLNAVQLTENFYQDANCTLPLITFKTQGSVQFHSAEQSRKRAWSFQGGEWKFLSPLK